MDPIDDDTLQAYVDGQLDAESAARIDASLATDPARVARDASWCLRSGAGRAGAGAFGRAVAASAGRGADGVGDAAAVASATPPLGDARLGHGRLARRACSAAVAILG